MKTTALILLLTGFGLWTQMPPMAQAAGAISDDDDLRNALRVVVNGRTNPPAAKPAPATVPQAAQPPAASPKNLPAAPSRDEGATSDAPTSNSVEAVKTVAAPVVVTDPTVTNELPAPDQSAPSAPATAQAPGAAPAPAAVAPQNPPASANPAPGPAPRRVARRTNAPPGQVTRKPAEPMIDAGQINFTAAELGLVLNLYAELVNRTILRAPGLPSPTIALKTQTPLTKTEAIEALEAVLALNGVTLVNIGDKFVKALPVAQADAAGAVIREGDASSIPEMGQHVTQIVHLKYAKPSEVGPILQTFGNTKSVYAVDNSGILVIRDYSENVKRMLEMIEQIDEAPQTEIVSEVIPIKYALAADISSALSSVSGQSSTTSVGASGASRLPSTRGTGNTAGNTGLAGQQNNYRQGQTGGTAAGSAPSSTANFSDRLRSIINRAATPGGAGDVQILGQTKIIADERTNSLLVFATRQDMAIIKDIINKLDVVLAQVLIEAIIMEVSLNSQTDLGISYLQHQKTLGTIGSSTVAGAGALNNGRFLNGSSFGTAANVVTNALNAAAPGGFSYWASIGDDLEVTATAIAQDGRVNVLSRPSIQTSHAVQATLFIGNTVPYITGTTYGDFSGASSRSVYEEKSVGISLNVLPLINPDGLVVMDIEQDIEQLGTPTQIDGNDVPTTSKRSATAKVAVRDRDTIILGGFISNTKTSSHSGVPLLKDIPLLGYLFRSSTDIGGRVELIVLLRPTVLPTPEAAARVATEKKNQLPGVRRAEAEQNREEKRLLRKTDGRVSKNPAYGDQLPTY